MTTWPDERIPIWIPPVQGEALDSWLATYSRRLRTSVSEFMHFLGLPGARLDQMVRFLTESEQKLISRRTGLSSELLTSMTLEPWDGSAVSIERPRRCLTRPPAWRHTGRLTRYCPLCLEETQGRWQISWRLPWSFACTRHSAILLERCPSCRNPAMVYGHRYLRDTPPASCLFGTAGANVVQCGFPLGQAPSRVLPPDSLVLPAQLNVKKEVIGDSRNSAEARQHGQELSTLARAALRLIHTNLGEAPEVIHRVISECGGDLPSAANREGGSDAHPAAVGTAIANVAVDAGHPESDAVFKWLLMSRHPRQDRSSPASWLQHWVPAGPRVTGRALAAIDTELNLMVRLRYGTATTSPTWPTLTLEDVQRRASHIPAMLWPSWTMRLLPRLPEPVYGLAGLRRACAALLLVPGSTCDYTKAAALLGNRARSGQAVEESLTEQAPSPLASFIVLMARALDKHPCPINYQRRRSTFSESTIEFEADTYQEYCRRRGLRAGTLQISRLRWFVTKLLLGSDPGRPPCTPKWSTTLALGMSDELKMFVHQQAVANLKAHGITEPVSWEPPTSWLPELVLPIFQPGNFSEKISESIGLNSSIKQLAHALGVSADHVQLHVESTGINAPRPIPPPPRRRGHTLPRQGVLSAGTLCNLYEEQELSIHEIARLANCSTSPVRSALLAAKITLRPGPSPRISDSIARDWLEREYSQKGRSAPDIARELGTRSNNVLNQLKRWGIQRNGLPSNPFAQLSASLSPAMQRVSRKKNCVQGLRNLLKIPGQRNLSAAASYIGTVSGTLSYQLSSLEKTAGITIIARSTPLAATADGEVFLAEAKHLLSLLTDPTAT